MMLDFNEVRLSPSEVLSAVNALGATESILGHGLVECFPLKPKDSIRDTVNAFGFDTQMDLHYCLESLFTCTYRDAQSNYLTIGDVCHAISERAATHYSQVGSLFGVEDYALTVYGTLMGPDYLYFSLQSSVESLYSSEEGIALVRRGLVHYPDSWQVLMKEIRDRNPVVGLRSLILGGKNKSKQAFLRTSLRSVCRRIAVEECRQRENVQNDN